MKMNDSFDFDPFCLKCHTTGFEHPGGYNDLVTDLVNWPPPKQKVAAKVLEDHNKLLRNVGCENCHGPCSEHVKNPKNKNWYPLINPLRPSDAERVLEDALVKNPKNTVALQAWEKVAAGRMRVLEQACMKCHDHENDVHWGNKKDAKDLASRWLLSKKRLIHHTPKNNNGAADPPPAKKGIAPAGAVEELPPIVIEVIEDKKK